MVCLEHVIGYERVILGYSCLQLCCCSQLHNQGTGKELRRHGAIESLSFISCFETGDWIGPDLIMPY
jgi:hypothetical protein